MAETILVARECKQLLIDLCREHKTGTFERDETTYAYPVYHFIDKGEKSTIISEELNLVIQRLFNGQKTIQMKDFAAKAERIKAKD